MPPTAKTTPLLPEALGPYSEEERARVGAVMALLREESQRLEGFLPFDRYMELALYAPGLGYYVGGLRKFGAGGDFVTAPEISPLFSRCLAVQCEEVLGRIGGGDILEFGAGAGTMAVDLLLELARRDALPGAYRILELSADLRDRQREAFEARAPELLSLVRWSDALPEPGFRGVVLGNELLDAMPVHRFRVFGGDVEEMVVAVEGDGLVPRWVRARPELAVAVDRLAGAVGVFGDGYASEVNLRLGPWLHALGERVVEGAVLLADYGYSAREYYHPERVTGTLVCHFRHRAHADPLVLPGLQDITANVDFSAVAEAGVAAGFDLAGYATQAHFLLGSGLDTLMADADPGAGTYVDLVQGVKQLTLPSEMGERFKVLGLSRGAPGPLRGFAMRDLGDRL